MHFLWPLFPLLAFAQVPAGFVSLAQVAPSVQVELRYFSSDNFVGEVINGYSANTCYLARPAAEALARAQATLLERGFSLKVYDCYRPVKAVSHFVAWAADPARHETKARFYSKVDKSRLFKLGYIAHKSGHSRGSTVDLTIVPLNPEPIKGGNAIDCASPQRKLEEPIDMGTNYDCFSDLSRGGSREVTTKARANRKILADAMMAAGFEAYSKEWWHFTLKGEPFPDTYFDFDVE